jgi:serine/threonine protein kinase
MATPAPGLVLGGKYRLVRPLGRGGLAAVWYAEHLTLHSPVALKIIDPVASDDHEESLQRFLREARAAAALRSPHVVQILDYGVDQDLPYIVMELLEGESLEQRLERQQRLGIEETARVIKHVARAMSRAHEAGIVHRDLKPANIFLVPNDDEEIVKVLDFGVAKATTIALGSSVVVGATPVGALLGTPHYMSPEQAEGNRALDHRTDLWSMGIIAFECLLGDVPFKGHSLGSVITSICSRPPPIPSSVGRVPAGFDVWFLRACARSPSARFESARQMADEFAGVCQLEQKRSTTAPPPAHNRTEIGLAPPRVQPAPPPVRRPEARAQTLHGLSEPPRAPSHWLRALLRYKLQLVAAACVTFATAVVLLQWRAKPRIERPLPPAPGSAATASPAATLPERAAPAEPFSGLGRRVGSSAIAPVPSEPTPVVEAKPAPPSALVDAPLGAANPTLAGNTELEPATPPPRDSARDKPTQAPARTTVRASTTSEPTPAAAKSCEPPWYLDKAGIRRVKPQCL